jgi:hypothetical protein
VVKILSLSLLSRISFLRHSARTSTPNSKSSFSSRQNSDLDQCCWFGRPLSTFCGNISIPWPENLSENVGVSRGIIDINFARKTNFNRRLSATVGGPKRKSDPEHVPYLSRFLRLHLHDRRHVQQKFRPNIYRVRYDQNALFLKCSHCWFQKTFKFLPPCQRLCQKGHFRRSVTLFEWPQIHRYVQIREDGKKTQQKHWMNSYGKSKSSKWQWDIDQICLHRRIATSFGFEPNWTLDSIWLSGEENLQILFSYMYNAFVRPSQCPKWSLFRPLLRCRRRIWHVNLWSYFTSHFLFIH